MAKSETTWDSYVHHLLSTYYLTKVKPKTHRNYELYDRLHVSPRIGHYRLHQITAPLLDTVFAELLQVQAPSTVDGVRRFVSSVLSKAERDGLIDRSPVRATAPIEGERRTGKLIPPGDVVKILKALQGSIAFGPATLSLLVGSRITETLHLTWESVDLKRKCLTFTRKLKSRTAHRTILLPAQAVELLRSQSRSGDYVFCTSAGTPHNVSNVERAWRKGLKEAGLKGYRFHDLRHTCVTGMIARGVPLAIISEWVGHASTDTTTRVYGHLETRHLRTAVNALEKAGYKVPL